MIKNKIYVIEWGGSRGLWEITLPEANTDTAVKGTERTTPNKFRLAQNYPNPFNGQTHIKLTLEAGNETSLQIFSVTGQLVRTLADQYIGEGSHTFVWDSRNDNGRLVASGNYHYQVTVGGLVKTRQLTLLK